MRTVAFFSFSAQTLLLVVMLLLGACTPTTQQDGNNFLDPQYIQQKYYGKPFVATTHMGDTDDYQKALSLYNEGKYQDAVAILEKLNMETAEYKMVLANAYMQLKQYEKAVPLLKKAAEDVNYANEAKQYIIVCLLMQKQVQLAKIELEEYLKNQSLTPKDNTWANDLITDINQKAKKTR